MQLCAEEELQDDHTTLYRVITYRHESIINATTGLSLFVMNKSTLTLSYHLQANLTGISETRRPGVVVQL